MDIPRAVMLVSQLASYPQPSKPAWEQDFRQLAGRTGMWQEQAIDIDIHPLFSQNNFSSLEVSVGLEQPPQRWLHPDQRVTDSFYLKIRPALVLATRFLKQSSEYLDVVFYGTRMEVPTEFGMKLFHQRPPYPPNPGFPSLMDTLRNIQFYWGHSARELTNVYGYTRIGVLPAGDPSMFTAAVQISSRFTEFFQDAQYENHPQVLKNAILFLLASVLVHELTHVWNHMRYVDNAKQGDVNPALQRYRYGEPHIFKDEPWLGWLEGEIGYAWSRYLLGGIPCLYHESGMLDKTTMPLAAATSLAVMHWDENCQKAPRFLTISPALVAAFLDDRSWTRYELRYGVRHLQDIDVQQRHSSVFGTGLISRMEKVITLGRFQTIYKRLPSAGEFACELIRHTLIGVPNRYQNNPHLIKLANDHRKNATIRWQAFAESQGLSEATDTNDEEGQN